MYYDPTKKLHPTGRILKLPTGHKLCDYPEIEVEASGDEGIARVDVLGSYDGMVTRLIDCCTQALKQINSYSKKLLSIENLCNRNELPMLRLLTLPPFNCIVYLFEPVAKERTARYREANLIKLSETNGIWDIPTKRAELSRRKVLRI